ncbi:F0F1 ATP synthase subunit gamma [Endothiovibrio diazotrophicus]
MAESLEILQRHIASVEELHSIVRTMKTLSAVAIRQYEKALESLEEYQRTVLYGLSVVLRDRPPEPRGEPPAEGWGIVVFGTDTGLCGRFNEDVTRFALERVAEYPGTLRLMAVGERVCPILEEAGRPAEECMGTPGTVAAITPVVQEALVRLEAWHAAGIGRLALVFNRQLRGEVYRPHFEPILPVDLDRLPHYRRKQWPSRTLPDYTMEGGRLFAALLRQHLFASVFRASTHSLASENASRLRAMQAAERNIDERLQALLSEYRAERQNAITEELLDVVSGFEALKESV